MSEEEEAVHSLKAMKLNKKVTEDQINTLSMILKNLSVHAALIVSCVWKHVSMHRT